METVTAQESFNQRAITVEASRPGPGWAWGYTAKVRLPDGTRLPPIKDFDGCFSSAEQALEAGRKHAERHCR